MSSIIYKRALTDEELNQILRLQRSNIPAAISEEEKQNEGFVTVQHTFKILKAMNDKCAHIIAVHNSHVIGYALSMDKSFRDTIDVLKPMFDKIDKHTKKQSYIVMGQICIDKKYRKQGVFRGLYNSMKMQLSNSFDAIITEVDRKNIRSLNAHYAIGFNILYSYRSNNQDWEILIWDIK